MCRIKQTDASKLQDEYAKLVEGLKEADDGGGGEEDDIMGNPGTVLCSSHVLGSVTHLII